MGSQKKFIQFGPTVWPAIASYMYIYIYTHERRMSR